MQQIAPRPWVTAGVALAGASLIAVTPVTAAQLPDIQVPDIQLTAAGDFDPIGTWESVLQTASTNATDIWDHFSAAPFPVAQQVLANQIGYLEEFVKDPASIANVPTEIFHNLQAAFGAPFEPFLPDNPADFIYPSLDSTHAPWFDIFQQLIPTLITDENLQPLVLDLLSFSASPASGVLWGSIGTMLSPALQFGSDVTGIVDALSSSDPMTALQDLVDMPANITNAFLNGYGPVDLVPLLAQLGITLPSIDIFGLDASLTSLPLDFGGLLSPGGSLFDAIGVTASLLGADLPLFAGDPVGPIASMVELAQSIAMDIGWSGSGMPLDILSMLF
ncbi:outer membrane porin GjpA [Mycobacterium sp. pUA109]|uniref:outer membrane porin GjpA n=1 Tax=Mycobacterium sp. pUA109 TaxID=3238982 RepID=UPI00351B4BED